jgi:hypothetical protein
MSKSERSAKGVEEAKALADLITEFAEKCDNEGARAFSDALEGRGLDLTIFASHRAVVSTLEATLGKSAVESLLSGGPCNNPNCKSCAKHRGQPEEPKGEPSKLN